MSGEQKYNFLVGIAANIAENEKKDDIPGWKVILM